MYGGHTTKEGRKPVRIEPSTRSISVTPVDDYWVHAQEYTRLRAQKDAAEKGMKALRDKLMEHIKANGVADSTGSVTLSLPESLDGKSSFVAQRRTKTTVDEGEARRIADEVGLEEAVFETVKIVSSAVVFASVQEGILTEDQMLAIFPEVESWALTLK
jgi:hypothetical protein